MHVNRALRASAPIWVLPILLARPPPDRVPEFMADREAHMQKAPYNQGMLGSFMHCFTHEHQLKPLGTCSTALQ
eukprot:1141834-Pelagomonas_calceolata.AAC.7